eukprot:m.74103 g.74103  ORF g.74103 m.74103 type:complete len:353 (-) comp8439_c1_seq2:164-1222(-)
MAKEGGRRRTRTGEELEKEEFEEELEEKEENEEFMDHHHTSNTNLSQAIHFMQTSIDQMQSVQQDLLQSLRSQSQSQSQSQSRVLPQMCFLEPSLDDCYMKLTLPSFTETTAATSGTNEEHPHNVSYSKLPVGDCCGNYEDNSPKRHKDGESSYFTHQLPQSHVEQQLTANNTMDGEKDREYCMGFHSKQDAVFFFHHQKKNKEVTSAIANSAPPLSISAPPMSVSSSHHQQRLPMCDGNEIDEEGAFTATGIGGEKNYSSTRSRRMQVHLDGKREPFSKEAVKVLEMWYSLVTVYHSEPYLSGEVKEGLSKMCKLTKKQVTTWVSNRRNRGRSKPPRYANICAQFVQHFRQ